MLKFFLALALCVSSAAVADEAPERFADADYAPTLIGGEPAKPEEWPASVYAKAGSAACSATVVGEQVVVIAAHCVGNGKTITFSAGSNSYSAKCDHHPKYRSDSTADWALCKTDKKVAGVLPELVAQDGSWCAKDVEVQLTGYGCTRPGGGGGNDGVYRIGKAKVSSCPARDNDTITKGGAALCYGDSGGPAFKWNEDGSRELFAVNSRGDIRTTSYLSTVTTQVARDWFQKWMGDNGVWICGFPGSGPCRGGTVPPPPPPPPPGGDCTAQLAAVEEGSAAVGAANASLHVAVEQLKACVGGH